MSSIIHDIRYGVRILLRQPGFTVVAVIVTIAQVVTSVLAAYAFVFLKFPGKNLIFAQGFKQCLRNGSDGNGIS